MLLVALCGSVYGLFALRRENDDLRERLRVAQGELDALNIYDATMVWGRTVRVARGRGEWRWRLYFPSEQRYRLHVQTHEGKKLCDDLAADVVLGPGELTLQADLSDGPSGGSVLTFRLPGHTFRFFLDEQFFWSGHKYGTHLSGLSASASSSEAGATISLVEWTPAVLLGSARVSNRHEVQILSIQLEPVRESIAPAEK